MGVCKCIVCGHVADPKLSVQATLCRMCAGFQSTLVHCCAIEA